MTDPSEPGTLPAEPIPPVDQVIAWLLEGHRDSDISQAVKAKWPAANHAEIASEAMRHFERAAEYDLDMVVGWSLEAYRDLYRRMIAIGDFANAMKAVKELAALAAKHVRTRDDQAEAQQAAEAETGDVE